jgi:hypothetical protein
MMINPACRTWPYRGYKGYTAITDEGDQKIKTAKSSLPKGKSQQRGGITHSQTARLSIARGDHKVQE